MFKQVEIFSKNFSNYKGHSPEQFEFIRQIFFIHNIYI